MGHDRRLLEFPPEDLEVMRQRSAELARVPVSTDERDLVELLEVHSRGQSFALPLHALEGVVELTSIAPVPTAPAMVKGLVTFRGELLLGIELSALVGNLGGGVADLRRIIAVVADGHKVAILAERVLSIRVAPQSSFRAGASSRFPFVTGVDENFVSLLDAGLLISYTLQALDHA